MGRSDAGEGAEREGAERGGASHRIVAALSDDILHGRLKAGERVDEVSLARRFATSRTPVREALGVLTARELLRRDGRRLAVASYDREELGELFEAMNEIEGVAASLAALRMPLTLRSEMLSHQEACRAAAEANDLDGFLNANEAFHFVIYRGTRNRFVCELATGFRIKTASTRTAKYRSQTNMLDAVADHDRIIGHINGAEHEAAATAMRSHVGKTHMSILAQPN